MPPPDLQLIFNEISGTRSEVGQVLQKIGAIEQRCVDRAQTLELHRRGIEHNRNELNGEDGALPRVKAVEQKLKSAKVMTTFWMTMVRGIVQAIIIACIFGIGWLYVEHRAEGKNKSKVEGIKNEMVLESFGPADGGADAPGERVQ